MRRRRPGLKPETFPFLAVLLSAMGALILLLLVMDRRAKIVAKAKLAAAAQQAVETRTREQDEARAAREAEWERRRQELHDQLAREAEDLGEKVRQAADREAEARQRLRDEEAQTGQVRQQLDQQQAGLKQDEAAVAARKQQAAQAVVRATEQMNAAVAERARLGEELRRLEQTLADLKVARQKKQKTFALVPYRGKHGDTRPPLYLECTSAGLVFHPDPKEMSATDETAVRNEVERRAAGKVQNGQTPFVLFLIRPHGITSYYQAVAALKDVKLDFGYELVDAGWALEFPDSLPDNVAEGSPLAGPGGGSSGVKGPFTLRESPTGFGSPHPQNGGAGVPRCGAGFQPTVPTPQRQAESLPHDPAIPAPQRQAESLPHDSATNPSKPQPASTAKPQAAGAEGPPPPRPLGNREWTVSVECRADGVIIYPGGQQIALTTLATKEGTQGLMQSVQQMATRRQALATPGEPGYRISVRFLVRPDGTRSYYLAYPALDPLRLPMTRQNLDPDSEVPGP